MFVPFIQPPDEEFSNSKSWGPSHTHRERLLKLAICQAPRMRTFQAADLTAQEYRDIFRSGTFDYLHVLILRNYYRDFNVEDIPAPTREDIGHLQISAPSAAMVDLDPTLPIAYEDRSGLSLHLPGLRRLSLNTADHRELTVIPRQLCWIPALIRGAPGLTHLVIYLPMSSTTIDWAQLCGEEPFRLPALRSVQQAGRVT
ncbi:hypothetical protein PENSPDRAFT_687886 [Peniophora sp. CONT]|nr:hypothetical protein PENSPDRAFT_687886 [Peniophora sp. CONT]